MLLTQFNLFEGEIHFLGSSNDYLLETILDSRPASVRMPVIKIPRSMQHNYSDSELASAAMMLEKLKKRRDVVESLGAEVPARLDQEKVLDLVADRLLRKLQMK